MPTFFSLPYHKISVKNNLRTRHRDHIIVTVAIAMTLVATVALGSSTYAWFAANQTVTVTGMEVKAVVSDNLLIDNFTMGSWATNDSTFKTADTQTINDNNVLVPVSTVDGKNFYYTASDNVAGDGNAIAEVYTLAESDFANLKTAYLGADAGYLDYHFILKAVNVNTENSKNIVLTDLKLTCDGENDTETAFRVAILANKFTTATEDGAKTAPGLPTTATHIYTPANAVNFESGKAVASTNSTDAVTYATNASDSIIATVEAGSVEYYDVTVRLWLEGEDKTCTTSIFSALQSNKWSLDTEFKLISGTTGGVYNVAMEKTTGSSSGSGN